MREIKFRAWFYDGEDLSTGEMISLGECLSEDYIGWSGHELKPNDKCTILMQYTGLKDKNGVEIYEGDIIKLIWKSTNFSKEVIKEVKDIFQGDRWLNGNLNEFEIIGNVHENKELLNERTRT